MIEPVVRPVPASARTAVLAERLPTAMVPGDDRPMLARADRAPAVIEVSERSPMLYSAPAAVLGLTMPALAPATLTAPPAETVGYPMRSAGRCSQRRLPPDRCRRWT